MPLAYKRRALRHIAEFAPTDRRAREFVVQLIIGGNTRLAENAIAYAGVKLVQFSEVRDALVAEMGRTDLIWWTTCRCIEQNLTHFVGNERTLQALKNRLITEGSIPGRARTSASILSDLGEAVKTVGSD